MNPPACRSGVMMVMVVMMMVVVMVMTAAIVPPLHGRNFALSTSAWLGDSGGCRVRGFEHRHGIRDRLQQVGI